LNGALAILLLAALATSVISAIIGMGGGILLLAVMFCFLDHGRAIPVHAVTQLSSNSTRLIAYARHIDWSVVRRFFLGLLPGSVIGVLLLRWLGRAEASEPHLKMVVGLYVLVTPFLPKPKGATAARGVWWDWPLLGLAAGSMALTVGAVGPLIAPLFARRDFVKERLIATKATCQMLTHLIKLPGFVALGSFAMRDFTTLALPLMLIVIPGTLIGRRLLKHVSPQAFTVLYRGALLVAGLKVLLVDGVWPLIR
jgi:uncharacterized membrane protein YfcA